MPEAFPNITYVTDPFKGEDQLRGSQEVKTQELAQKRDMSLQKNDQARADAMPKQADAFLEGFILKCSEAGVRDPAVIADLLEKTADLRSMTLRDLLMHPLTATALGGGLGMGGAYALDLDPLLGGLAGAGLGFGVSDKAVPGKYSRSSPENQQPVEEK
jgi:hypothetical protein